MSKRLPLLAAVIGAAFVLLAVVYALAPVNALPPFAPAYDPALDTMYVKHGLPSLLVGVALWACAWFATQPQKPPIVSR